MNTIIAVPLDVELAEFIGKKGSVNGLTFYNRRSGSDVIVALAPSSIDEKFYALPEALLLADQVVVSTRSVDKLFGEVLVACSLLGKKVIFTDDNDISQFISGVGTGDFSYSNRESLLNDITSFRHAGAPANGVRVDIDKSFNVKGVGTVALGIVRRGTVRVHDALNSSSGKLAAVRSIQSQDQDMPEAGPGTRVGLALKGIDESDLSKGDILSDSKTKYSRSATIELKVSGFVGEKLEQGKRYGVAAGFSYAEATVEGTEGPSTKFKFEKPMALEPGDLAMVVRNDSPRIFAAGKITAIRE